MCKIILVLFGVMLSVTGVTAQQNAVAYEKLLQLTAMFHGSEPYSCYAISEVKYKSNPAKPLRDTSLLIYKNGLTHYKSRLVEHVAGSAGELTINHELKTVLFCLSDSIKAVLQKEMKVVPDKEFESMLDPDFERKDLDLFHKYVVQYCNASWDTSDGLEEIVFTPKNAAQSTMLSLKIRFDGASKVRYYEYTNREVYATDMEGNSRFRVVRTIYDNFRYENVPDLPVKLSDFLEWDGWTVRLKKYKNYQLSVL